VLGPYLRTMLVGRVVGVGVGVGVGVVVMVIE
jgi:hypothetical protein